MSLQLATYQEIRDENFWYGDVEPRRLRFALRADASYVVVCDPWEGIPYTESGHRTRAAAEKAQAAMQKAFKRTHPGGYGYGWTVFARRGEVL
jgi:hypothetical protein